MTNQIPAGLTRDEASAVREWAEQALAVEVQDETVVHVARVLLAVLPTPPTTAKENPELPDQTLDDQVRPIVAAMRAAMRRDEHAYPEAKFLADLSGYIKDLEALLAQRPTLADMTPKERAECRRMQADTETWGRAVILLPNEGGGRAVTLDQWGHVAYEMRDRITPRPDLPRLEWPGTEKPAPALPDGWRHLPRMEWPGDKKPAVAPALPDGWRLADHQKHGRGIVTNPTPNRNGRVYFVIPADDPMGYDLLFCDPDELTYLDQGADQ